MNLRRKMIQEVGRRVFLLPLPILPFEQSLAHVDSPEDNFGTIKTRVPYGDVLGPARRAERFDESHDWFSEGNSPGLLRPRIVHTSWPMSIAPLVNICVDMALRRLDW